METHTPSEPEVITLSPDQYRWGEPIRGSAIEAPVDQPAGGAVGTAPVPAPGEASSFLPAVPEQTPGQPGWSEKARAAGVKVGEVLGHAGRIASKLEEAGVPDRLQAAAAGKPGKTAAVARGVAYGTRAVARANRARLAVAEAHGPEGADDSARPFVPSPGKAKGYADGESPLPPINRSKGRVYESSAEPDSRPEVIGPHKGSNEPGGEFHFYDDPWLGLDPRRFQELMKTPEGRQALFDRGQELAKQTYDRLRFERGVSTDVDASGQNITPPGVNPHRIARPPRFEAQNPESTEVQPPVWGETGAGYRTDPRVAQSGPKVPSIDRSLPEDKELATNPHTLVERAKSAWRQAFRSRKEERGTARQRKESLDTLESGGMTQDEVKARARAHAASDAGAGYAKKGGHVYVSSGRSGDYLAPVTGGSSEPPKFDAKGRRIIRRQKLKIR